jgi:hypothetical protein
MTTAVALPTKAPVPTPAPVLSKAAPAALLSDAAADIPIFLRKTYHMVDTCDPTVACWSEDGETFVVKNPEKFEKQIIPQFFKHSKFSSFVRVSLNDEIGALLHDSHYGMTLLLTIFLVLSLFTLPMHLHSSNSTFMPFAKSSTPTRSELIPNSKRKLPIIGDFAMKSSNGASLSSWGRLSE